MATPAHKTHKPAHEPTHEHADAPEAKNPAPPAYDLGLLSQVATTVYVNDPNVRAGNVGISRSHIDQAVDLAAAILERCAAKMDHQAS